MKPCVRIEMMGGLSVLVNDVSIDGFGTSRPAAILAYLAYHRHARHAREVLMEHFWPDADVDAGRNRLNVTLARIRAVLREASPGAEEALLSDRSHVWIDANHVETDVSEMEERLRQASEAGQAARDCLLGALSLARGPLLHGCYEEWIAPERERLGVGLRRARMRLVTLCEEQGRLDEALEHTQLAVRAEPFDEEARRLVMRLLARTGRPAEAIQHFAALETALRGELETAPEAETVALCEEIRARPNGGNGKSGGPNGNGKAHTGISSDNEIRSSQVDVAVPFNGASATAPISLPGEVRAPIHLPYRASRIPVWRWAKAIAVVVTVALATGVFISRRPKPDTIRASRTPDSRLSQMDWAYIYPYAADETISEPLAVTSDRLGNTYVTGHVRAKGHDVDVLTLKISPEGKQLWRQRFNGPANDCERGWFLQLDTSGDLYVTCDSYNGDRAKGGTEWDILLLKYSPDGKLLWDRRLNGSGNRDEKPAGMGLDSTGNIYVAGTTVGEGNRSGFLLAKYAPNGLSLWTLFDIGATHQFTVSDIGLGSLVVEHDGTSFLCSAATITDGKGRKTRDLITTRHDRHGNQLWLRRFTPDTPGEITTEKVTVDAEHNVYASAMSRLPNPPRENMKRELPIVVKYDADGKEKWSTTCDQVQSGSGFGVTRLVVAPGGYVYTAIQADSGANLYTGYLFAFNSSGKLLWRKEFPWSKLYGAEADSEGVFVSFEQVRDPKIPVAPSVLYSRHYAREDGHEIWSAKYDPSAARIHQSTLHLSADGKLISAGQIWPRTDPPQLFLVQYPR